MSAPFSNFTDIKTKNKMRKLVCFLIIALSFSFLSARAQVNNPWVVPEEEKAVVNPTTADKNSISTGKSIYAKHCKTCHGKTGNGDGITAKTLNTDPSDLTFDDIDTQTDGEVYYKIRQGREEMPAFKGLIDEEDMWHLVNYIRTLYTD